MKKIYFITDGYEYKVGCSSTPAARLKQLQTANANELWIAYEFETAFGQKHETTLHRYLKRHHKRGEWFILNDAEFEKAKRLCEHIEHNFNIIKKYSTLNETENT
mgnify:CR=1 FL=1